jgi:hypothetical protein
MARLIVVSARKDDHGAVAGAVDLVTALASSFGPCEICGKTARCHDRPSSTLPPAGKLQK